MRYTKNEYESAKYGNLVNILKSMGYELKQEGHHSYKGVLHDSIVITENNGYHWNSRELHSKYPIELLKQILIDDYGYNEKTAFLTSIKRLAGTEGQDFFEENKKLISPKNPKEESEKSELCLPPKNSDCKRVFAYLCKTRGLDYDIVKDLVKDNLIYETAKYHNACFVTYDSNNTPRHAFLRGTTGTHFYNDVENSDKTYSFTMCGDKKSNRLYCFESAIDLISHATLSKMKGTDYRKDNRIALSGISFLAIDEFLKNNPQITEIVSCLDNDISGEKYTQKMYDNYSQKGYEIFRQKPDQKDFNKQLTNALNKQKEFEESEELCFDSD